MTKNLPSDQSKSHGGTRQGAGRKALYSEPTKTIRVPESKVTDIKDWLSGTSDQLPANHPQPDLSQALIYQPMTIRTERHHIPQALERVAAGFPSPAEGLIDEGIDLNEHLIKNTRTTFLVKVKSQSMLNAGIDINDELVVDRSIQAEHRHIVIALYENAFTVKRLMLEGSGENRKVWLKAENPDFESIYPKEGEELIIWGVVTYNLKNMIERRGSS